jgi:hypothetical protein
MKWNWMMTYCKENNLAPGDSEAWAEAEEAYKKHIKETE